MGCELRVVDRETRIGADLLASVDAHQSQLVFQHGRDEPALERAPFRKRTTHEIRLCLIAGSVKVKKNLHLDPCTGIDVEISEACPPSQQAQIHREDRNCVL